MSNATALSEFTSLLRELWKCHCAQRKQRDQAVENRARQMASESNNGTEQSGAFVALRRAAVEEIDERDAAAEQASGKFGKYDDPWDVAVDVIGDLANLDERTVQEFAAGSKPRGVRRAIELVGAKRCFDTLKSELHERCDPDVTVSLRMSCQHSGNKWIATVEGSPQATHSADFTSVDWFGTRYTFNKGMQAEAIRVLWEQFERGGHGLGQERIGEQIESSADRFRLAHVFRNHKHPGYHPAWGTMIQTSEKGVFRLVRPETPKNHQ
ncbi:MAG: hypothetical protein WD468_03145 [Pirellulales bacterium]